MGSRDYRKKEPKKQKKDAKKLSPGVLQPSVTVEVVKKKRRKEEEPGL